MNYLTTSKVLAYLTLIFIAGGVAGAAITWRHAPPPEAPVASMEKACSRFQDRMTLKLGLSQEQVLHLKPVFEETSSELHAVHTRALRDTDEIIRRAYARISVELTPEQRTRLERCNRERSDILQRRLKEPAQQVSSPTNAP